MGTARGLRDPGHASTQHVRRLPGPQKATRSIWDQLYQIKGKPFFPNSGGNPENTGLYNSDGVNTFATGAFAPGVTVTDVTYRMLAADAGVKWRGLSVNGQYFFRWLNNFRADGPIPVAETFDHGFETVVAQFVVPKKWELYGRTSFVFGQFRNSYEYAPGVKWYPLGSHLSILLLRD